MTTSTSPVSSAPGQGPAWHTLTIEDALRKQGVDAATGLSQAEAETRLKQYGPNAFTAEKEEPGWSLLATFLVTAPDFMQRIFGTKDLNIGQWIICIVVSSLILWVIEITKIFRRQAAAAQKAA